MSRQNHTDGIPDQRSAPEGQQARGADPGADHPREAAGRASGLEFGRPVRIGRNVRIGAGAIILPGVFIGDDALIGAGSVVTRDVRAGATAFGNPARVQASTARYTAMIPERGQSADPPARRRGGSLGIRGAPAGCLIAATARDGCFAAGGWIG